MTPLDAFLKVLPMTFLSSGPRRPGAIIEHCPKDVREALSRLTSDDLLRLRPDTY